MDTSQTPKRSKGSILVVDDDASIRAVLAEFFQQEGFTVHAAHDGPTALAVFEAEGFDMIFLDYLLPSMTGLEVAASMRRKDPSTPIILITGTPRLLVVDEIIQAGISQVLSKPFTPKQILACWQLNYHSIVDESPSC